LPTGGTGKDEDPTLPAGGVRFESTTQACQKSQVLGSRT